MSEPRGLPQDADCRLGDNYFKIGLRGRAFRWNGEEWLLSTIDVEAVLSAKPLRKSLPIVQRDTEAQP